MRSIQKGAEVVFGVKWNRALISVDGDSPYRRNPGNSQRITQCVKKQQLAQSLPAKVHVNGQACD